jgi:tetratricopeptide (TPR) repeat protein
MPTSEHRPSARGLRRPESGEDDLDLSKPVELVVLAVKRRAARCRLVSGESVITLRAANLHRIVPGQIAVVQPNRQWRHAGHPYLSGTIVSATIDVRRLGLVPLALQAFGEWDPSEEYWGEPGDEGGEPLDEWTKAIIARGPRPQLEMEQVLPGHDPEDFDTDPILEANDLRDAGDPTGARELLTKLLEADLRCLDAHAHLGHMGFRAFPEWTLAHYEVGVRIGELSLGSGFDGVLPWGLVDNRPFLRCMHGLALCLWRLERWDEAERVLERLLWLNPSDEQGMRLILPDVRDREAWVDDER